MSELLQQVDLSTLAPHAVLIDVSTVETRAGDPDDRLALGFQQACTEYVPCDGWDLPSRGATMIKEANASL